MFPALFFLTGKQAVAALLGVLQIGHGQRQSHVDMSGSGHLGRRF
jgi:hypothetical protein